MEKKIFSGQWLIDNAAIEIIFVTVSVVLVTKYENPATNK